MTRLELIESDEYVIEYVECIVRCKKPIRKIRQELNKFFLEYRKELLELTQRKNKLSKQ